MMIDLKPEHERILERAVKAGMSRDEVLDRAFVVIEDQLETEDWMLVEREAIAAHVAEGRAQDQARRTWLSHAELGTERSQRRGSIEASRALRIQLFFWLRFAGEQLDRAHRDARARLFGTRRGSASCGRSSMNRMVPRLSIGSTLYLPASTYQSAIISISLSRLSAATFRVSAKSSATW